MNRGADIVDYAGGFGIQHHELVDNLSACLLLYIQL